MNDLSLPNIGKAALPVVYRNARAALADCVKIDECKDWADKAEALASYARQAKDDELEKMARRIRARALDRVGELLKQIPAEKGGRPETGGDGPTSLSPRNQAARDAGLSKDQQVNAIRINNVPRDAFEEAVESDDPPTTTELAERGKKKREPVFDLEDRSEASFMEATKALGMADRFKNECSLIDMQLAWDGMSNREKNRFASNLLYIANWCNNAMEICNVQAE